MACEIHLALTPPKIGGFALIMHGFARFQSGHLRTQIATPLMFIFPNKINKLDRLRKGGNVSAFSHPMQ